MPDQTITLLKRAGVRPEPPESYKSFLTTRLDKVLYSRKFYRDSMIYRTLINRIVDLVDVYGAEVVGPDAYDNEFFYNAFREYLLTGEILFYRPTDQLLESERVEFEVDEDSGEVVRVLYDSEFEIDYDGLITECEFQRLSSVRGEPPFIVALPWVIQVSSLMYAQVRAAEIGSRLLARIVNLGGNEEPSELQLTDDVYVLRTNSPQDSVDYPKYTPADFTSQLKMLTRQIAAVCGMPYEVLFSDFTEANFSQSKAAYISARHEVSRYRKFIEKFASKIGAFTFTWSDVESLDVLEQARAMEILRSIGEVQ